MQTKTVIPRHGKKYVASKALRKQSIAQAKQQV